MLDVQCFNHASSPLLFIAPEIPADLRRKRMRCWRPSAIIEPLSLVRCSQKFQRIYGSEEEDGENEVLGGDPVL